MMNRPPRRGSGLLVLAAVLVTAVLLALLFGAANVVLPRILIIGLIGLLVVLPVYVFRPMWLIVPTIIFQLYFPSQPVADVVTVLLVARAMVTLVGHWTEFKHALSHPLIKPLIVIGLTTIISFAVGLTILRQGKSELYQAGRVFVYWLWIVPFVAWAPRERPDRWLMLNITGVAVIVALLATVQGAFGFSLVNTGRIAQLDTIGAYTEGITRVQIPGFVFVTFCIFLSAAQLISDASGKSKVWYICLLILLTIALIFNFGRAIWFWSVLGVSITAMTMGWRSSGRMIIWGGCLVITVGLLFLVAKPQILDTIVDRVASVAEEGGNRTSYGWREVENSSARKILAQSYLMGVGLGGEYRTPVLGLRAFENHTRYIHNGHLSVMLKISVIGYISYLALFFMILRQAIKQRTDPVIGPMSCAIIAWVFAFNGQNITQPDIMTAHGLTMLAFVATFLILTDKTTLVTQSTNHKKSARSTRHTRMSIAQARSALDRH